PPIPHAARHPPQRSASGENTRSRECSRRADIASGRSAPRAGCAAAPARAGFPPWSRPCASCAHGHGGLPAAGSASVPPIIPLARRLMPGGVRAKNLRPVGVFGAELSPLLQLLGLG